MFQFGGFPSITYWFSYGSMVLHHRDCPIRKSTGQSLFPAHRGLSQVVTSFIGSWCQGIHLMLFFAWTAPLAFVLSRFASCLSFANNCSLGCGLIKRPFFFWIPLLFPPSLAAHGKIVLSFRITLDYWKDLLISIIKKSLNTTICFVSFFFIRFSMNVCCVLLSEHW